MDIFAIYLPQFHEISENNKWWGKGFTEWTNVKKAKPLFNKHIQPVHPLNDNYYNLLDYNTLVWQANLAKEYGINGFVFYHYYFKGKLIMEKPAELLLNREDIPMNYFFCWANHTWLKGDGDNRQILIKQEYGDKSDWENHFQYMLKFFKDNRYKKINGAPVLMLYVNSFPQKSQMIGYWNKRCIECGFSGINIIETYTGNGTKKDINIFNDSLTDQSKLIYIREPNVAMRKFFYNHFIYRIYYKFLKNSHIQYPDSFVLKINGNKLYKYMKLYNFENRFNCPIAHGLFFGWDNTPRHGKKGYIISAPSKSLYIKYINKIKSDDIIFINAWNEWAEGMMIEPTKEYGYTYLEWIRDIKNF